MFACCGATYTNNGVPIPLQANGSLPSTDVREAPTSPSSDAVTTIFNDPSLRQSILSLVKSFGGFLDKAAVRTVVTHIGQVTLGVPFVGVGVQALVLIINNVVVIGENHQKCQDILKHANFIKEHLEEVDSTEHQEMLDESIICLLQNAWLLQQQNKERQGYVKGIWMFIKQFACAQSMATTLDNVARELQQIQRNLNTVLLVQANKRQPHFSRKLPDYNFSMRKIGLQTQIQHIMDFLERPTENQLKAVAVYGIGGIGKSTLLYGLREHISRQKKDFVVASELLSESSDVKLVQQSLFKQLTWTSLEFHDFREGQGHLEKELRSLKAKKKKVCLILDNLQPSNMGIIQNILPDPRTTGECVAYLIVSAREKRVVEFACTSFTHESNIKFHEPSLLKETAAKELFCEKAKMDSASQDDNERELTRRIVPLLGGLPLAVEVYGSFFGDKKKREPEEWMKVLNKLEKAKDLKLSDEQKVFQKIEDSLELYDETDHITLADFMDAALYWRGESWQDAKHALLWKNDDDGLGNLAEKSLVSDPSNYGGNLHMHDILVNIAKNKAEACQRIYKTFTEDDDPKAREGQEEHIHGLKCRGVPVPTTWLQKMKCLRFLHIAGGNIEMPTSIAPKYAKGSSKRLLFIFLIYLFLLTPILVFLNVTLKPVLFLLLSPALVVLLICLFPSHFIPSKARSEGISLLPKSLTFLTIHDCYNTINLADSIGNLIELRSLTLTKLHGFHNELPPSIFSNLPKLRLLDLSHCVALNKLPDTFCKLASLRVLKLSACSLLIELPRCIAELQKLDSIDLSECHSLSTLPEAMGSLTRLQSLRLYNCDDLQALPQSFGHLSSLQILDLSCSDKLARLPTSFGMLGALKQLDMSSCSGLKALPEDLGNLKSLQQLELSRCTSLTRIPPSIAKLKNLKSLNLSRCTALEDVYPNCLAQLQSTLQHLDMSLCPRLKDVSDLSSLAANLPAQSTWIFDSPEKN